ncbi:hypothetical protein [Paenibacillus kobensis]|nr:hypothetical protein [Paenibacillus kobensis]
MKTRTIAHALSLLAVASSVVVLFWVKENSRNTEPNIRFRSVLRLLDPSS